MRAPGPFLRVRVPWPAPVRAAAAGRPRRTPRFTCRPSAGMPSESGPCAASPVLTLAVALLAAMGCAHRPPALFDRYEMANLTRRGDHRTVAAKFAISGGEPQPGAWGEILVPENRRVPGSRLVRLSFRRIGAPDAPAVLYFTGGPGVSNLGQRPPRRLLEGRSVIEVGYRGIDSSSRLECRALREALTPEDLGAPESRATVARAFERCLAEWRAAGIDPQGYQLQDVVEDAEDVRRALGLDTVDLLASSYGTRVALHYQHLHPTSVRRVVLLGANPPGHFFWSAEDVRRGFDAYEPYFQSAHPEYAGKLRLEELFTTVLERLPPRDLLVRLDPERIRVVTFVMLFHRGSAEMVLDAYLRAYEDRNYHGLAALSAAHDLVVPRAFDWGDFFLKGLADHQPGRDYAAESSGGPGRFGSPLGALLYSPPYAPETLAFRDPPPRLEISRPTLILSGELDFSTPDRTAREELTDRFPAHVQQLTLPGHGHVGDLWRQSEALGDTVARFLAAGEVGPADAFRAAPVRFRRRVGLTHAPVAIGVAVAGSVAALLGL
jgi:pimeloyl-ACP methyl ester carboxylesterase